MLICIPDILTGDQIDKLVAMMDRQTFIDGRETAGWAAAGVKENKQVASDSRDYAAMQAMVTEALAASRFFATAAMPRAMRPILFSRYTAGMSYGPHVDNALMGDAPQTRIDLAFTLFLSDPDSYEGGELEIEEPAGTRAFKLPAGAAILYPANSVHEVTKVTSGRRDVAVGWIQSLVRGTDKRRILFELENLRTTMFAETGKTAAFDTLTRNTSDLWRMWAEN
ncbi:Fe2+-dependent dioxygenase [Sphingopyxis panaciterrulae]|uniref:PKHD-type hydroxylase n=1 Tax=Sphingopyxis panaciterrulae TaxID=462372 RepID=A0A7W9B6M2_9SPHN|nr:Fe2+-dependent dioxygenase [Sphingopyxis panaciterrulae]MBB5707215.1 PKHD-type hydroxylase [Sphingopyxis panaciterrulae]